MRVPTLVFSMCILFGLAAAGVCRAETVWFEVAEIETERNQSFLVPLSDPEHIAHARALIANGGRGSDELGSILIASIQAGGDGFNRDLRDPDQRLWRWHVDQVEGFANFAIELCDGWPGFVEENPEAFIENTNGAICFWSYTVKSELAEAPTFEGGNGVDGAWYNPATSGQGFFIDAYPQRDQLGIGWFTWADGAPGAARPGDKLWFTGIGGFDGDRVELEVYESSGGEFDSPRAVNTLPVGTATLVFANCNQAELEYSFSAGDSGRIALQRLVPDAGCRR